MSTRPDFNPQLDQWQKPLTSNDPGAGAIEQPGQYRSIVWQTRTRVPTERELRLAQALERAPGNGASEVADLVEQLNDIGAYNHGRVHALEDCCPHRGARLATGWNQGGRRIVCWYHGIEVGAISPPMRATRSSAKRMSPVSAHPQTARS